MEKLKRPVGMEICLVFLVSFGSVVTTLHSVIDIYYLA